MKVVLIGNCQVEKLAFLLPFINNKIKVISVKQVHLPDQSEDDQLFFLKALDECDLIISHRISEGYQKDYVISENLLKKYPVKIKFITNFWFNGYDPSFFILKKRDGSAVNGPLGPNCFFHVLEGYILSLSVDEIYNNWVNLRGFESRSVLLTENSLSDLKLRDEALDIKCADWVSENFKNNLITHTVNHPSISFLLHQAFSIANYIFPGHAVCVDESVVPDNYKLNFYSIAPNPFICKYFDLQIKCDDVFRGYMIDKFSCNAGVRLFSRKELILSYLEFFPIIGNKDDDFLVTQLNKLKINS